MRIDNRAFLVVIIISASKLLSDDAAPSPPKKQPPSKRLGTYQVLATPLLRNDHVRAMLKISPMQKIKLDSITLQYSNEILKLTSEMFGDVPKDFSKFANVATKAKRERLRLNLKYDQKLVEVLSPPQLNRLAQLSMQYQLLRTPVPFLTTDPQIGIELKFSKQQRQRLKRIEEKHFTQPLNAAQVKLFQQALAVLTPQQRRVLSSLRGALADLRFTESGLNLTSNYDMFRVQMQHSDKNGDGAVTKQENPMAFRLGSEKADINKDGKLDVQEIAEELRRCKRVDDQCRKALLKLLSGAKT